MATPEVIPEILDETWCESGVEGDGTDLDPGDVDPDGGDIAAGWEKTQTPPRRQRWNWVLRWLMQAVRYLLHIGVGPVVEGQSYAVGDVVCGNAYGSNRFRFYRCILAYTAGAGPGALPGTDETHWEPLNYNQQDTDEAIEAGVADGIGTVSGALAEGTITASGGASIGYRAKYRFPGSDYALVACRLTLAVGQSYATVTLSGAATFAVGVDGATATIADPKDNVTGENPYVQAKVVDETNVYVFLNGFDQSESTFDIELLIRGH